MNNILKELRIRIQNGIINPELKDIFENHTFIAGGCIRSLSLKTEIKDVDIYFTSQEKADRFKEIVLSGLRNLDIFTEKGKLWLKTDKQGFFLITDNAITFSCQFYSNPILLPDDEQLINIKKKYKGSFVASNSLPQVCVQFVTIQCGNPRNTISQFDFTNSMGYYHKETLVISEQMQEALKSKQLIFNPNSFYSLASLNRIKKFKSQGWNISPEEFKKVLQRSIEIVDEKQIEYFTRGSSY